MTFKIKITEKYRVYSIVIYFNNYLLFNIKPFIFITGVINFYVLIK